MTVTLKEGQYVGIDEERFDSERGVAEAKDTATGETVIVKAIFILRKADWEQTKREVETLRILGSF